MAEVLASRRRRQGHAWLVLRERSKSREHQYSHRNSAADDASERPSRIGTSGPTDLRIAHRTKAQLVRSIANAETDWPSFLPAAERAELDRHISDNRCGN